MDTPIIDAHVHFSRIASFQACAERDSLVDYSFEGYEREAEANGVELSVVMGLTETSPGGFPDAAAPTPMLADLCDHLPGRLRFCPGVNPHTLDARAVDALEVAARSGRIAGFKLYAGYYHAYVYDAVYAPVYRLAEKHDLPVAIHAGDTYSDRALLAYSHPLSIDRLAVDHPELRVVLCHMGVPWVFDACELALKNRNVYLDISGMYVGSPEAIARVTRKPLSMDRYRQALEYLDNYDKILFGTDWPLAPMDAYIAFARAIIPAGVHTKVFRDNAARVFRLG